MKKSFVKCFAFLMLLLFFFSMGCTNTEEENIVLVKEGDVVSVHYTGKLSDGTVFDSSVGRDPLSFTVGAGQMISGFDQAVVGMSLNGKKTVTLSPEEAYGPFEESLVIFAEAKNFENFDEISEGMIIYANNRRGKIVEKKSDGALIDFNHELAGKTLIFEIELVSVTPN